MDARELERKAELAELLLHVARQLGESLEPERVYERFHELLADVVAHDGIVVSSYDRDDGLIRCEYAWVEGELLDTAAFPALALNKEGGGMQSRVITSGEPLLVNDVREQVETPGTYYEVDREGTFRELGESGPPKTQAAMMVPVKHEGQVIGVVQVMSDHVQYAPEQLEMLEALVAQMAASVRNARLREERSRLETAEATARAIAIEREQAAPVLAVVGDGNFLVDRNGRIRLWNRSAERMTECAADVAREKTVGDVFANWATIEAAIPVAEGGTSPRSVTLPVQIGTRELWLSFVAVRSPYGVVYAFRDLTSERRLEEEKNDFVATVSHELRTPMAAVYGAAETLRSRPDLPADQARRLVEMIATQAARLTQITEEVLLTTQLDRGEIAIGHEPVDIARLAIETVETMREQLGESAPLEVDVEPDVGAASGDADRIQQVLVNLLDNAVKYGGGGPVRVRVDALNGFVRVSVADSGPGVAPAEQPRIFEKFYRSDPQLTHAPGGTGLGLYISRELVVRMGGRLVVQSEPGAGATFTVELPRA